MMRRLCYALLKRCHDVPIKRREDVPLRRLGDVPARRFWVFHLRRTCDVAGTSRETSLQRLHEVLLPGGIFLMEINFALKISFVIFRGPKIQY